jgi:hypothetical protein
MDGMGAADGLGTAFREAHVAHAARLDHLGDRSDRLLNRDGGVHPPQAIDVDVVRAEPLQPVGQGVFHRHRPTVDADEGVVGSPKRPELHADHGAVPDPGPAEPRE